MAWLGNVGRNSMTYYVWHWILLDLVSILYYILGGESNKILWGGDDFVLYCISAISSAYKNKDYM